MHWFWWLLASHTAAYIWGRNGGKEFMRQKVYGAYHFLNPEKKK